MDEFEIIKDLLIVAGCLLLIILVIWGSLSLIGSVLMSFLNQNQGIKNGKSKKNRGK